MTFTGESNNRALLRAQAEAAAWMALLHSPQRNAAIERGLMQWMAADPLHAAAWESATDVWNDTEGLPRRIPRQPTVKKFALRPLVVAAICLTVVIGGLFKYYLVSAVTTTVGEQRTLNLDDGTRVELNTDSRLRVDYDQHTRTVILESGEAYFQVAHEPRPFIVIVGERKIVALGTVFTVRRDGASDDAVTVTLIEGRVAVGPTNAPEEVSVAGPGSAVTILNAGQRLRARPNARLAVDAPSIDKATAWMRGQLIFDHTTLREAAAEFSRYNKVKVRVASPEVAQIQIGGIFRIGDSKSFADAVAAAYDLTVTPHENELVLESALPTP